MKGVAAVVLMLFTTTAAAVSVVAHDESSSSADNDRINPPLLLPPASTSLMKSSRHEQVGMEFTVTDALSCGFAIGWTAIDIICWLFWYNNDPDRFIRKYCPSLTPYIPGGGDAAAAAAHHHFLASDDDKAVTSTSTAPLAAVVSPVPSDLYATPEIGKCIDAFRSIHGCLDDTLISLIKNDRRQIQLPVRITTACCKVIAERLEEKCWTEVFPPESSFPEMVKNYCAHQLFLQQAGSISATSPLPPSY